MLMYVTITMPLTYLRSFLGRCVLSSRAYEILKNSIITHHPESLRDGNTCEFLCTIEDAKTLLLHAKQHYPIAGPYIEDSLAEAESHVVLRKIATGDTWHSSPDCSTWPTEDFISAIAVPNNEQMCNECLAKRYLAGLVAEK
jgi:hypothetical protein